MGTARARHELPRAVDRLDDGIGMSPHPAGSPSPGSGPDAT